MRILIGFFIIMTLSQCASKQSENTEKAALPFLGIPIEISDTINGEVTTKDVPPTVPDFKLWNQDSILITQSALKGKLQVVDFFFTKCPTLCPIITKSMDRVHLRFKDNEDVQLVSFSIDYINDTVATLSEFAEDMNVSSDNWHFLECDPDQTYDVAKGYVSTALEDKDAPGGYDHTGNLVLVDKEGYVRSFCNGKDNADVDRFMEDIETLLNEK